MARICPSCRDWASGCGWNGEGEGKERQRDGAFTHFFLSWHTDCLCIGGKRNQLFPPREGRAVQPHRLAFSFWGTYSTMAFLGLSDKRTSTGPGDVLFRGGFGTRPYCLKARPAVPTFRPHKNGATGAFSDGLSLARWNLGPFRTKGHASSWSIWASDNCSPGSGHAHGPSRCFQPKRSPPFHCLLGRAWNPNRCGVHQAPRRSWSHARMGSVMA